MSAHRSRQGVSRCERCKQSSTDSTKSQLANCDLIMSVMFKARRRLVSSWPVADEIGEAVLLDLARRLLLSNQTPSRSGAALCGFHWRTRTPMQRDRFGGIACGRERDGAKWF